MSFILLVKRPDDQVLMLSEDLYETRKDATDALAGLTSEPSFEHWDAEVFVVDLDKATPVLLVRPASPESASAVVAATAAMDEAPADAGFVYAGSDAGEPEDATESLVVEDDEGVRADEESGTAVVAGDAELSVALSELGLGDEPAFDDAAPEEDEGASLRDAIARTTAQMAASGIVPPESVGPEGLAEAEEKEPDEAGSEAMASEQDSAETAADGEQQAPDAESADAEGDSAAWPWAAEAGDGAATPEPFVLSALEEPGVDEGSLVKASGDQETVEVSRPVILGDYDDIAPAEPMSVSDADDSAPLLQSDDLAAALSAAVAEAAPGDDATQDSSDGEKNEAAAPVAESDDALSCDDCVYFQTCPNKEDREPSSCGSFQWK